MVLAVTAGRDFFPLAGYVWHHKTRTRKAVLPLESIPDSQRVEILHDTRLHGLDIRDCNLGVFISGNIFLGEKK